MTKDEIKQLAERVASGIATDEEVHLYNQLYNSFQQPGNKWEDDIYGNRHELEMAMRKDIWKHTGMVTPMIQRKWFRWAAAAAVTGIIGTWFLFVVKNGKTTEAPLSEATQKERFKNDVAPGQQGAILTLSNGKTIILDSAGNGALAQQGATEIIKKDGQIVYANAGHPAEVVYNTMATPKGRQYSLVLADGSKVWLNAASSITFPTTFSGAERKVTITGEAYFEIAHKSDMPFIVEKGEMNVQVLGTHFNINSYDDEQSINVTLLEGSVKVTQGSQSRLIKPGQQAQLVKEEISLVNNADIAAVMAWKNGTFSFNATDMESLMRQLCRWYDVEVVYNKKVNELFYADIPRNTNLSDALKALELTGKVKFEIDGKKIIVIP